MCRYLLPLITLLLLNSKAFAMSVTEICDLVDEHGEGVECTFVPHQAGFQFYDYVNKRNVGYLSFKDALNIADTLKKLQANDDAIANAIKSEADALNKQKMRLERDIHNLGVVRRLCGAAQNACWLVAGALIKAKHPISVLAALVIGSGCHYVTDTCVASYDSKIKGLETELEHLNRMIQEFENGGPVVNPNPGSGSGGGGSGVCGGGFIHYPKWDETVWVPCHAV